MIGSGSRGFAALEGGSALTSPRETTLGTRFPLSKPTAIAIALVALVIAGCTVTGRTVTLRTQAPEPSRQACLLGAFGGVLAADAAYGLGLEVNGVVHGVLWPPSYSALREATGIVLIGGAGLIIAKEGDTVEMAGTFGDDGIGAPCDPPELKVVRQASS